MTHSFQKKKQVLALIPARGGSKGVKRKNIIKIAGKPLIAYSIEQAIQSKLITRIIVSTDDEEIRHIAAEWGAETPFQRPAEFAQDHSPDLDVFRHALQWLKANEDYTPDLVVHLRPTGPVRKVEIIDQAIERLLNYPDADSLRSISMAAQTPYKMWTIQGEYLSPVIRIAGQTETHSIPRQQLPKIYLQNGYVDVIRPKTVLEKNSMAGDTVLSFIVNEPMLEIDYIEDVPMVEDALQKLARGEDICIIPDDGIERYPI